MSRWTHSPAPAQATHKGPPRHGDGLATSAASTRVVLTSAQTYFAIAQTDRAGSLARVRRSSSTPIVGPCGPRLATESSRTRGAARRPPTLVSSAFERAPPLLAREGRRRPAPFTCSSGLLEARWRYSAEHCAGSTCGCLDVQVAGRLDVVDDGAARATNGGRDLDFAVAPLGVLDRGGRPFNAGAGEVDHRRVAEDPSVDQVEAIRVDRAI